MIIMYVLLLAVIIPSVLCRHINSDENLARQVFSSRSLPIRVQRNDEETRKRELAPTLKIKNAPPKLLEVGFTESVTLECEAGGNPPPTIHWLKDGKRIPQSVYDVLHPDSEDTAAITVPPLGLSFTRSRLFVDCVGTRDEGTYTCVAENSFHRESQSTVMSVSDSPQQEPTALCLSKKSFGGAPARIHMWTHNRLELIGNDVQLFCRSNGEPQPKITWIGPDELPIISDAEKYQVLENGDLVIRSIEWTDMGIYTCEVKNSHGSDFTGTFLYPAKPSKSKASAE